MKLLYKLLRQEPDSREGTVVTVSGLNILVNLIFAAIKVVIGLAVSSIAIVSEGVNNATDSATSLITIVGTKLSAKHPTEKHPFGFGRIEYLTSLLISVLILFTGAELMESSVKRIFAPQEMSISYVTMAIIAVSALVKLALGLYTIKEGRRVDSSSLVALGTECRSDSVVSVITLVTALVFLVFHVSLDAYAGIIMSLIVLKAGFEVLKETLSDILGQAGEKELAQELYRIIRAEPLVLNAADMMLHNYGPDAYSGSVNVEIDHSKTVGEVYAALHELQLRIMHEKHITMVFGIYAVDKDHKEIRQLREQVAAFVREQKHVTSYHALYIHPNGKDLYVDLVVDYDLADWEALRKEFTSYMAELYPDKHLELVIETNYV
ncbi:MAG: cation diffusion facilitator family transporter [Clostridiales bacterium]|nr:cation diffusion facilitator family transporter [Clostridiales bacterium]